MSRFFGEELVNQLFVQSELNEQYHETESRYHCADDRHKEKQHHACKHERYREINPAEKRIRIFLERFHVRSFATAVVFEIVRHILASHFLSDAAGIAFWHVVADMRNFVAHKLCTLSLVVNKTLQFAHNFFPSIR